MSEAFIVGAVRSAGGRKAGRLSTWHPVDLAGAVIAELVRRVGLDPAQIEDVILGCVGQAGEQSTNIARNAALAAGFPESVPGTTVDRQCGSSQQAIHFAAQAVMAGAMDVVIAGGVESMSRVPMGTAQRLPFEAGLGRYKSPRLEQCYPGVIFDQFSGAEMITAKHGLTKDALDLYGYESQRRAGEAARAGLFDEEILALPVIPDDPGGELHRLDEGIRFDATLEATRLVRLLREGGSLTAATSSQVCDGASALLICNAQGLKALGATPLARIHSMFVLGGDPILMLETPIEATQRALVRAGLTLDQINHYEVNEAFASIPLAWARALSADPARLNPLGGAIALGHPLGASGGRLMTTMVHALRRTGGRFGLQTMCEGGGLANVTIIERLER